ncbi:unnamed protein product [Lactuca virosa]|uniref:F-box domain-containing protein n=1 Tax=Lactuca virosa TaxID=75947 RepID=A0AAU9PRE0_9ASTR|nr:unnamed protein product [Lactuca virosa]
MALKNEHQQRQPKTMKTLHTSEPSEDTQLIHTLAPEIIIEILLRLPVESLLRSRSVCKLWRSIISDPHFIKSHLSFSISNNHYAFHRLIFSTVPKISIKSCPLYDVLYDGSVNALELNYPLKHSLKSVWIAGSCNGLLLITNEDYTLFIWNPSTRRSNMLPNNGVKSRLGWHEKYGLGCYESTDDYKVVGISSIFRDDSDGARYDTIVKIYSLKTGNWKKTDDFHNGFPLDGSVTFLNGAFHWAASRKFGSSYSWTIVSLDLAKETYGEILQPVYDEGDKDLTLGAVGEWLCVLCDYYKVCADVWVMKVYGVKDSWIKLVSIPYLTDPGWDQFSVPLCISNDRKVLLQFGLKLVVYDSRNCSFSEIQKFNECLDAFTFVESLVSPIFVRAGAVNNNDG